MASVAELKDAGSSAYAAGKHKQALDLYTQALDQAEATGLAEGLHILFSNRYSTCCCMEMSGKACSYMQLQEHGGCIAECYVPCSSTWLQSKLLRTCKISSGYPAAMPHALLTAKLPGWICISLSFVCNIS